MASTPGKRGIEQEPWQHLWTPEQGMSARNTLKISIPKQCANVAIAEEYSSICGGASMKIADLEAMMQKNVPLQVVKLFNEGWFLPGVTQESISAQMPKNFWHHVKAFIRDIKNEALPKLAKLAPGGDLRSGHISSDVFASILQELWDDKESARVQQARQRMVKSISSDGNTPDTAGVSGESSQSSSLGSRGSKEVQPFDKTWEGPLWWPVFVKCCCIGPDPQSWCCAEVSSSSQVIFLVMHDCLHLSYLQVWFCRARCALSSLHACSCKLYTPMRACFLPVHVH